MYSQEVSTSVSILSRATVYVQLRAFDTHTHTHTQSYKIPFALDGACSENARVYLKRSCLTLIGNCTFMEGWRSRGTSPR